MSQTISTTDLTKEFGAVTALDGIDLDVSGSTIVGVAGPNGSGKTTLIECLLGLIRPTAGEGTINGTSSGSFTAAERRRIGYMPQDRAIYDDLSVRENVSFFASLYDVERRETAVDEALSVVDLTDREGARIGELSGGMVRRTSLACSLVHDPDVLFLDEPTIGLDPKLRASMWEEFRDRRDDGVLVFVSTHYLGEASRCDRVLFLRDGRVLAIDSPAGFRDRTGAEDMEAVFLDLLDGTAATGTDRRTAAGGGAVPNGDGRDSKATSTAARSPRDRGGERR
ncbi:ABC transporter ATP-binding protein [Halovivax limisalsi]|uniref:ABC transporter ATP-binding protein n=1 Tax=Halovivax limisalsi TaxID=1453760 RepID=UPI001FFD3A5E|nr:ABC transporter ATP-binding protein [Halovivax limisalsi]